jgi:eukaryotic-like serine/threonine-protein kinase
VLKALSTAATSLRNRLGESLASVQKFDVPVEATTPSLEALKAYSMGVTTGRTKSDAEAIPFMKRAIELDPNFAIAYAGLAVNYSNLGQASLSAEYARKAYDLRDRVSERERYRISALYFQNVTSEVEKATEAYELWAKSYPPRLRAARESRFSLFQPGPIRERDRGNPSGPEAGTHEI